MKQLVVVVALLGVGAFIAGSQINHSGADEAKRDARIAREIAVAACEAVEPAYAEMAQILRDSRAERQRAGGLGSDARAFYERRLERLARLQRQDCRAKVEREVLGRKGARRPGDRRERVVTGPAGSTRRTLDPPREGVRRAPGRPPQRETEHPFPRPPGTGRPSAPPEADAPQEGVAPPPAEPEPQEERTVLERVCNGVDRILNLC